MAIIRAVRAFKWTVFLIIIPIILFIISFGIGRYNIDPLTVFSAVWYKLTGFGTVPADEVSTVLFNIRLPRLLAALIAGAALSAAGAVYQGMFRNPLVSPDILGATAGAGFGAALGIFMSLDLTGVQIISFICGLTSVGIAYLISVKVKKDPILMLVLSGILLSTIFSSGTSLLKYMADPNDKLPAITFWLMGSLSRITMSDLAIISIPIGSGVLIMILLRWRLNVMTMGDDEAKTLGINTSSLRLIMIVASTAMTACVVSVSGQIGWVGLVIPHLSRMTVGPDFRKLLPVSIVMGGVYLMLVDDIARAVSTAEIPIGILTAVIGAPFFLYLIIRDKG